MILDWWSIRDKDFQTISTPGSKDGKKWGHHGLPLTVPTLFFPSPTPILTQG